MGTTLFGAWRYKQFIVSSIRNEFLARFARSKVGGLWMVIHPLSQVLIFALILSEVISARLPDIENKHAYALYLMAGMLAWMSFSEIVTRCLTLFIDNGNLMKKMAFPRICLPLIASGAVLVNNTLLFAAILVVFVALGHVPSIMALWLPLLIMLVMSLGLGVGLILGVINVFIRDIGQVVPVILQALFWLTPIVYTVRTLPETYRDWFVLNPLYPLVTSFQNVLVFGQPPEWGGLMGLVLAVAVTLPLALFIFRKASAEMVDSL
ncbi:MAG: ABC transporter permease [Gammaproteobacteria bacterium]|nr:ABC transporter permease [Gammaproteobacteria bacterium]